MARHIFETSSSQTSHGNARIIVITDCNSLFYYRTLTINRTHPFYFPVLETFVFRLQSSTFTRLFGLYLSSSCFLSMSPEGTKWLLYSCHRVCVCVPLCNVKIQLTVVLPALSWHRTLSTMLFVKLTTSIVIFLSLLFELMLFSSSWHLSLI